MKIRIAAAVAALAFASGANASSPFFRPKVAGNEVSVTVENVQDPQKAYDMADAHCAKFNKLAKRTGGGGYTYIFECVPK